MGRRRLDPAEKYAKAVVNKRKIAGPHVRAACQRHLDDLKRKDVWYDRDAADWVVDFFRDVLTLKEGKFEGLPFVLDAHQEFIVRNLFGWKKPADEDNPKNRKTWRRRYRRAYIEIAKGNGKSPLLAGLGLYGLLADGESGAQIYSAAATKDQARIVFDDAVSMVQESPALSRRLLMSGRNPVWQMVDVQTKGKFRPLSRDAKRTGSGLRPHFALIDELHEHPDRGVVEMLERGFKFRRQPLLVMATNSGTDKLSVCYEEHQHAIRVARGMVQDDETFSFVASLDDDDDPFRDKRVWVKANPLLDKVVRSDEIRRAVKLAGEIPGQRNNVLRLHFCRWTDAELAWIAHDAWMACEDPTLNEDDFRGRRYWGGLDLSAKIDMTAYARLYEDGHDDQGRPKFAGFCTAYMPADTLLARSREDRAPYDVWVEQGHVVACPGAYIRYDAVARDVAEGGRRGTCMGVAYDQFLFDQFERELRELNSDVPTSEHPQGYVRRKGSTLWMPGSIDVMETMILERRVRWAAHPPLRAAVASATMAVSPAGLRRFAKSKATARIDCAVAAAMACGAADAPPLSPLLSYYQTEDAIVQGLK